MVFKKGNNFGREVKKYYETHPGVNKRKMSESQKGHIPWSKGKHFSRDYWTKLFQEKLSKLYNYKYSENNDIILNLNGDNNETKN